MRTKRPPVPVSSRQPAPVPGLNWTFLSILLVVPLFIAMMLPHRNSGRVPPPPARSLSDTAFAPAGPETISAKRAGDPYIPLFLYSFMPFCIWFPRLVNRQATPHPIRARSASRGYGARRVSRGPGKRNRRRPGRRECE